MVGAPALDAGLLRSPAGTNPPGREKRGARQEKAQLVSKTHLPHHECVCMPDRPRATSQASCPVGSKDHPITCTQTNVRGGSGQPPPNQLGLWGAPSHMRKADLFRFIAWGFRVSRTPSEGRDPFSMFLLVSKGCC